MGMAISSVSGVASISVTRPVDSERPPGERKQSAPHDEAPESAQAETPTEQPAPAPDGEHHIHVVA